MAEKKLISIVTPCYNEEATAADMRRAVADTMAQLPEYDYEHIFIDNCSTDRTREILRELCGSDKRVKGIFNSRNFGQMNSPFHGLLQAGGDAVVLIACDFQEPPELIVPMVRQWEQGNKMVLAVKNRSRETPVMFALRKLYYKTLKKLSNVELINNYSGFGLYDRRAVEELKRMNEPYPYFRGMVAELGFRKAIIPYEQARRVGGKSSNNFSSLFDVGMMGLTSYSRIPLRIATFLGIALAAVSIVVALLYLILKLIFWYNFSMGMAPLLSGVFFLGGIQLVFIGLLGEYIGTILTKINRRPLVIEEERLNFDE